MASGGPLKELCEEASCSICLDYFRDPVTITECGHSFCRACLTRSWGEPGAAQPSCPQCRGRAKPKRLRPNRQLANFVELIQKLRPLEAAKGAEAKGGVCEKHREPLQFFCREDEAPLCLVCRRSPEHKDHEVVPLEEAAGEKEAVGTAGKGRVCQKHEEPLKLFCKDDEALICVVCDRSKEHRDHETLPLEEASQEYQDQFCSFLEVLKKERERIVAYKGEMEKESQDLLKQVNGEKQEMVDNFRQMHTFLEEQEGLLLAQMEEVEKEVARNRDEHLARLSEELSSLESLIREMEEKCEQSAGDLLQDARNTLQRYEERESFENPVAFPLALKWHIWDFSDLNPLLEAMKKQLKDTLDSGLHLQKDVESTGAGSPWNSDSAGTLLKAGTNMQTWAHNPSFMLVRDNPLTAPNANVTLDPDTAHPLLILSEDQKSVRVGEKAQDLPNNPERFDLFHAVLGHEGFTRGRHFWEVLVGSEGRWAVGVARKSVRRKGNITFRPEEEIWEVGKWSGTYQASMEEYDLPLTLTGELKRIRVCLNCAGGRVAFFDADREALLHEFSGASFRGETLLPFFWVCEKGHLTISS